MYPSCDVFSPTQNISMNRPEKQKHSDSSSFLKPNLLKIHPEDYFLPRAREQYREHVAYSFLTFFPFLFL